MQTSIAGIEAIWRGDPRARVASVDSVINVVPPRDRPDLAELAARHTASQLPAWDWLAGQGQPDLGGRPHYRDIVGVNFYHYSQWEYPEGRLRWEEVRATPVGCHSISCLPGPTRATTASLSPRPVTTARARGVGSAKSPPRWRGAWEHGVPVEGICLYPIIDRPEDDPQQWHRSGLWIWCRSKRTPATGARRGLCGRLHGGASAPGRSISRTDEHGTAP